MATRKTSKRRGTAKKKEKADDPLTRGDLAMFKRLGIGEDDATLRALVKGQRRLNGRLLVANQGIKKVLRTLSRRIAALEPRSVRKSASSDIADSLKEIAVHLKYVGGDEPPGCQLPLRH